MRKAMIFIDGSWLYFSAPRLADENGGHSFQIDYGKLPGVLAGKVCEQFNLDDLDVVRTHIFVSNAVNYDFRDEDLVQSREDFFSMLKEEYHYEVDVYPVNFRKRRIRKFDRDADDDFEPKEKCVDIALASSILYYAAVPNAYDIAVVLIGDKDYIPALHSARKLGKRIVIASIRQSCTPEFSDPDDAERIRDTDLIWLNDLISEIELKYEKLPYQCESLLHEGDPTFWTDYRPRKGEKVYCQECRRKFAEQKQNAMHEYVSNRDDSELNGDENDYQFLVRGRIKVLKIDRGYGFIETVDSEDYFFHYTDLLDNEWDNALQNLPVQFMVKQKPSLDKAGAAKRVKIVERL